MKWHFFLFSVHPCAIFSISTGSIWVNDQRHFCTEMHLTIFVFFCVCIKILSLFIKNIQFLKMENKQFVSLANTSFCNIFCICGDFNFSAYLSTILFYFTNLYLLKLSYICLTKPFWTKLNCSKLLLNNYNATVPN